MPRKPAFADLAFEAEIERIRAERHARELERPAGDGKVGRREDEDDGPRYPTARELAGTVHADHSDRCLGSAPPVAIAGSPNGASGEVDETWVFCKRTRLAYHRHGERLAAHLLRDRLCSYPGNKPKGAAV